MTGVRVLHAPLIAFSSVKELHAPLIDRISLPGGGGLVPTHSKVTCSGKGVRI